MEEAKAPDISSQYLSKERMELLTYLSGDVSRVRYHATERTVALERALTDLPGDVKTRDKRLADIDRDLHIARDDLDILSTWENTSERIRNEARARVAQLDEALLISAQMIVIGSLTVPAPSVEGDRKTWGVKAYGHQEIIVSPVEERQFISLLKDTRLAEGLITAVALIIPSMLMSVLMISAFWENPANHVFMFYAISIGVLLSCFGTIINKGLLSNDSPMKYLFSFENSDIDQIFRLISKINMNVEQDEELASKTFIEMYRIADGKDNEAKRRLADWIVNYKRLVMPINPQSEYTELTDKECKIVTSLYGEMLALTRDPEVEKEEMRQKLTEQREELERISAQEEAKRERESAMDGYLATHPAQTD